MAYNPKKPYEIVSDKIKLLNLHKHADLYLTRPPYQRKTVWETKRKQELMDSIIRRYYVPNLVLREVRLDESNTIDEVVDGQQRITTVQDYYNDGFNLPNTLADFNPEFSGKKYSELPSALVIYLDDLTFNVDRIIGIDHKETREHQEIATEIFWRLQQGEPLLNMEIAHARLSSPIRNFIVKYADDLDFDFQSYTSQDHNPHKHNFFQLIARHNKRMGHLALLARFILIERAGGYGDIQDTQIRDMINEDRSETGVGDLSFESTTVGKAVLSNLKTALNIFANDPMAIENGQIKELSSEYFIVSIYLLIRHLRMNYAINAETNEFVLEFLHNFHQRWRAAGDDDPIMLRFTASRQQAAKNLRERDMILREIFFEWIEQNDRKLTLKDGRRAFSEYERIKIYRRDKGQCQTCLAEGKGHDDALVAWVDYQADHIIPWIKGGKTILENAQVLCKHHNASKGSN